MPRATTARATPWRMDPLARPGPSNHRPTPARPRNGTAAWAAQAPGYLLRVFDPALPPSSATRLLRVPSCITFGRLHRILSAIHGWSDRTIYYFHVHDRNKSSRVDFDALPCASAPSLVMTMQPDAEGWAMDVEGLMKLEALQKGVPFDEALYREEEAKLKESEDVELNEVFDRPDLSGLRVEYTVGDDREYEVELASAASDDMARNLQLPDDQMVFYFAARTCVSPAGCTGDCGAEEPQTGGVPRLACGYSYETDGAGIADLTGLSPANVGLARINERLRKMALGRMPPQFRGYL